VSLVAFAVLNGVLAAAIVAALAYVCTIPFRLDRSASPTGAGATFPEPVPVAT